MSVLQASARVLGVVVLSLHVPTGYANAARRPRPDQRHGLVLGGQRGEPVDRRRQQAGPAGRLHLHRFGPGPQGLRLQDHRLRRQRHRLPGHRPGDRASRTPRTGRTFVYLPIVAGGTSFPYNLSYAGRAHPQPAPVRPDARQDLHQPDHHWDDPAIKADNNGKLLLPHMPIIPVVHSEGSGSTASSPRYLAKRVPDHLERRSTGLRRTRPSTSRATGRSRSQNGSDGVMNFITSSAGNGVDRLRRVLLRRWPRLPRRQGAEHAPATTQRPPSTTSPSRSPRRSHPATRPCRAGLPDAEPRQRLRQPGSADVSAVVVLVHDHPDRQRTTSETKTSSTAQRQTLADFLYYSICQGQAEIGPIGYSPLPINLVQDGFGQIAKLKKADPAVDLTNRDVSTCNNPTFIAGSARE